MQLKAKIRGIESRVKINDSPFCSCESYKGKVYPRCEIVCENDGVQTIENPIADTYEQCRKAGRKAKNNYSLCLTM